MTPEKIAEIEAHLEPEGWEMPTEPLSAHDVLMLAAGHDVDCAWPEQVCDCLRNSSQFAEGVGD